MKKPIVGQILFSLNIGNAARNREQNLTPMIVTRVGTKRFYCVPKEHQDFRETGFFLSDWSHDNRGYYQDHKLFETEQAWLDLKEAEEIVRFISNCFEYRRNVKGLSLASLRAIREIIEPEQKQDTCGWTPQGGTWLRDCARAISMWESVPAVCPFCGKRIEVKK